MDCDYLVKTVDIPQGEIEYLRFGSGKENLIIISGLALGDIFKSAPSIANAYGVFTEKYTVYLFERRKEIKSKITVEDMAEDIVSAIYALGIFTADFLGVSQGGMILQVIAGKHPSLVRKAVFGSSAAKLTPYSEEVIKKWTELALSGETEKLLRSFYGKIFGENAPTGLDDFIRESAKEITEEDLKRFSRLASACRGFNGEKYLTDAKCDSLVLGARPDRVLTAEASVFLSEKLRCPVYLYEKYGHAVYDTAPDYKKRVLRFLNNKNA